MFTYLFFLTPAADLRPAADQRAGGGAGDVRRAEQAERGDGVQGVRGEPVPPGGADPGGSTLLSGGLFAFDFYYVPDANRKQDALRDEIKGRATADLSASRIASGSWAQRLAHLLLQVFR